MRGKPTDRKPQATIGEVRRPRTKAFHSMLLFKGQGDNDLSIGCSPNGTRAYCRDPPKCTSTRVLVLVESGLVKASFHCAPFHPRDTTTQAN